MKNKRMKLSFCFLMICLFLSSCFNAPSPTLIAEKSKTSTGTIKPSSSPTTTEKVKERATNTPTFFTTTPLPTRTAVIKPSQTWTPEPTLLPAQMQGTAEIVFKTNGGCTFPCWMGITPGKTKWEEAKTILSPYAILAPYPLEIAVLFHIPYGKIDPVSLVGSLTIQDKLVSRIFAIFSYDDIPIWKFLSEYGKPEEIRVFFNGWEPGVATISDVSLELYYPTKGILASYDGNTELGNVHVCPNITYFGRRTTILLWDAGDNLSFAEAGHYLGLPVRRANSIEQDYLPIQKVSKWEVTSFYETYKEELNQNKCFDLANLGQ